MWGQVVSPTRIYSSWAFVSETDVCIWPTQLLLQRSNLRKQLSTFGIQLLCVERQLIFSKAKKTVTHWLANLNQISCPWAQRVPSSPSYKRAVGSGIIHAFITLFWGLPPIALWPQCCVRWSVQEHHQIHRRIERRHHSWRAAFWGAISWGRLQITKPRWGTHQCQVSKQMILYLENRATQGVFRNSNDLRRVQADRGFARSRLCTGIVLLIIKYYIYGTEWYIKKGGDAQQATD